MLGRLRPLLSYIAPLAVLGVLAYAVLGTSSLEAINPFREACAEPIMYAVTGYDARFGLSEEEFEAAVTEAATLWNESAGRTVLLAGEQPDVTVHLLYDERQRAVELGERIGGEQDEYEQMKETVDLLSARFVRERSMYESRAAAYEAAVRAYEQEVEMWNARGGAPPAAYEELEREKRSLERRRIALRSDVDELNALADTIQARVGELNALAEETNRKVNTYNKALGHDFDQGNYVEDEAGKRITIFTFEDTVELKRVLAHEFGHALGIGHVEDAGAIMYSYNIGNELELGESDIAALKEVCEL